MKILIYAGGVYHLCWSVFDFFWPYLFNWEKNLAVLDDFTRPILWITSKLLSFLYAALAYFSFFYASELTGSPIGRSLLFFVAIFWTIRALMQIRFYGFQKANQLNINKNEMKFFLLFAGFSNQFVSTIFFIIMLSGIALYLLPALSSW